MTVEFGVPQTKWSRTRCEVPFHHHMGPTAECREIMRKLEAVGPDAIRCAGCGTPMLKDTVCGICGLDYRPAPTRPLVAARGPLRDREGDGRGCVERTSLAERVYLNGGGE